MEYRKHKRKKADLVISFAGEHGAGTGTVFNLAQEGCGVVTDARVPVGAFLEIQIQSPGAANVVKIDVAVVRYCLPDRFGLHFLRIAPDQGQKLKQLLKTL